MCMTKMKWPTLEKMQFSAELLERNRENDNILKSVCVIVDGA